MKKFCIGLFIAFGLLFPTAKAFAAETLKLTLDQAVAQAVNHNVAVERAENSRESMRWLLSAARRNTGPKIHFSANAMRLEGQDYRQIRQNAQESAQSSEFISSFIGIFSSLFGDDEDSGSSSNSSTPLQYRREFSYGFSISYPLYSGGLLEARQREAKYRLNAADLAIEQARQEVRYNTQAAYYQLLECQAIAKVHEEAVENLLEHMKQVNIQYIVGVVAWSDVLASEVQIANERRQLASAKRDCTKAMIALNNLMGLPAGTVLEIEDVLSYSRYEMDVDECVAHALKNRPDNAAGDYAVKQAKAVKSATKSGYRPTVTASFTRTARGEKYFTSKDHGENSIFGVVAEWDIFDNGVIAANVKSAEAEVQTAYSNNRQIRENIELEVHQAYADLVCAEQNIEINSFAAEQAAKQYRVAEIRYIEGVDTNLTVMDAQEKLTEARTNYYNSLYNYNTARAALEKAIGVPVATNVELYVAAENSGKNSKKSLQAAKVELPEEIQMTEPFAEP